MKKLTNQIPICLLFLLLACSSRTKSHWPCEKPLPGDFKIVKSDDGEKFLVQSSWSRERIDDYSEKQARYKYSYHYLGKNDNGWVVEVPEGMGRQFTDSCEAKNLYGLLLEQKRAYYEKNGSK